MKKQFITLTALQQVTAQLIEVADTYIAHNILPDVSSYQDSPILDILADLPVPTDDDDNLDYPLFQMMRLALVLHYSITSNRTNEELQSLYNDVRFRDRDVINS
jgi:hypothetical protein